MDAADSSLRTTRVVIGQDKFQIQTDLNEAELDEIVAFVSKKVEQHTDSASRLDIRKQMILMSMDISSEAETCELPTLLLLMVSFLAVNSLIFIFPTLEFLIMATSHCPLISTLPTDLFFNVNCRVFKSKWVLPTLDISILRESVLI